MLKKIIVLHKIKCKLNDFFIFIQRIRTMAFCGELIMGVTTIYFGGDMPSFYEPWL